MKVLPFTIPVSPDRTIIVQEEVLPHFYPYLHRHAEIQITWIQQGEGTLLAGNSMHAFGPGDLYVLGANLPHLLKSSPEYFTGDETKGVRAVSVFFNPTGKISALFDLPVMKASQTFFNQWQSGFKLPCRSEYTSLIEQIQRTSGAEQLALFISMISAMSTVKDLEPLSSGTYAYSMTDPEGMRIASVYNYIMTNYSRALTLDEVARQAHLTPNAFCRYFKKHTRVTFVAFVNKIRVNEACKLLAAGKHNNIAAVAYGCGFSSITNFNAIFRSITGKSPRAYINDYARAVKQQIN
jgi:AraC-like DNA-binding protein